MASVESIMHDVRTLIRDFPQFFTASAAAPHMSRNIKLPHQNTSPNGLVVWAVSQDGQTTYTGYPDGGQVVDATTFTYLLDSRNGLLRIAKPPTGGFAAGTYINVEGYFYDWLADSDLRYHLTNIIAEHQYRREGWTLSHISDAEVDAIALGAAAEALFSLLVEYSREIDVNAPEAVTIPASQRFRQVESLLFGQGGVLSRYKEKANLLGVGLDRIEMFDLRRVSRTTGRLVPLYKDREWDDASRPERMFPAIDAPAPTTPPPGFVPARYITGYWEEPSAYDPAAP